MGYRCPVCTTPQSDGEHLANHLAFTAMLGDDDHEAWLAETVPEWGEMDPPALADRVVDHAEETDFPQVFEDTTTDDGTAREPERRHGHQHDHTHGRDHEHEHARGRGHDTSSGRRVGNEGTLDEETRAALERTREMTRRHRSDDTASDATGDDHDTARDATGDADATNDADASATGDDADADAAHRDEDTDAASGDETE